MENEAAQAAETAAHGGHEVIEQIETGSWLHPLFTGEQDGGERRGGAKQTPGLRTGGLRGGKRWAGQDGGGHDGLRSATTAEWP